ncbi:MAG: hypothetical protein AAF127_13960 [Pseudomonadota bacterium]
MSKISLTLLCIVVGGIVIGMWYEVPAVSGKAGALIVDGLVYSYVVAKRDAAALAGAAIKYNNKKRIAAQAAILSFHVDEPFVMPDFGKETPGNEEALLSAA